MTMLTLLQDASVALAANASQVLEGLTEEAKRMDAGALAAEGDHVTALQRFDAQVQAARYLLELQARRQANAVGAAWAR